jgi:hypothetical protein
LIIVKGHADFYRIFFSIKKLGLFKLEYFSGEIQEVNSKVRVIKEAV